MAVQRKRRAATEPSPTTLDPIEIAMETDADDTRADSPARRLLVKQERLVDAQLTGERLSNGIKALTGLAGVSAAVVVALMAWTASRADGLVIDAFTVPPALVEQGVTGEAVARQLIDELAAISDIAKSGQEERGVSGGWAGSLSIQIPATGISLSQLNQWLRESLGHQSHVGGEVMAGKDGTLVLRARSSGRGLPLQSGPASDMAGLIHRTAEDVYKREQPLPYTLYLGRMGRTDELIVIAREMTTAPDARSRSIGFNVLALQLGPREGDEAQIDNYRKAIAADPTNSGVLLNLAVPELRLGHVEAALQLQRRGAALHLNEKDETREAWRLSELVHQSNLAQMVGDWQNAIANSAATRGKVMVGFTSTNSQGALALARARAAMHEPAAAEAAFGEYTPVSGNERQAKLAAEMRMAQSTADWPRTLQAADALLVLQAALPDQGRLRPFTGAVKALALAHMGQIPAARTLIGASPLDCQPCVSIRGEIAEMSRDQKTADHWFGEAVRMAPSIPFASTNWGRALLDRGETDRAIAQFTQANRKSPQFADPISFWGEALLKQGKAKAAIAKFRDADKYAPRWGRNHMLWGEALAAQGRTTEAKAQFTAAAGMDLTPDERARLAKAQAHG